MKSIVYEVNLPVSKKEIDRVLREWAELRVLGRRAVACIPKSEDSDGLLVMPSAEYEAYIEAVTLAGFSTYAWDSGKPERILGTRVVVDDTIKNIVLFKKGEIPEKYRKMMRGRKK